MIDKRHEMRLCSTSKSNGLLAALLLIGALANDAFAQANNDEALARKNCAQAQDIERQISGCSAVLHIDPKFALAYAYRGIAYHNRARATKAAEDLQLAITDFTKAIELKPDHADQYILRGIAYTDSGNKDAAIADFRAALLRHPNEKTRQYAEQSLKELGAAP